ncbi:MAG: helix-turn-helix domain-containing protein [Bacteroidota bacterium]|nr:helix-turn-helix domain-containing protein [Bacteroidota bacterium]
MPAGIRNKPLVLSAADRDQLQQLLQTGRDHIILRVRIVLACADGEPAQDIAQRLGVHNSTVYVWRKRYLERGIERLCTQSGGIPKKPLVLSEADRDQLQRLLQSDNHHAWTIMRARIVLAYADGESSRDISRRLGVSENNTNLWRKLYIEHGIERLYSKPKGIPQKPLILSAADRDQLLEIVRSTDQQQNLVKRARIVLALAEELSEKAVVIRLGVQQLTVIKWRKLYFERGIEGLYSKPTRIPKKPLILSAADRDQLQAIAQSDSHPKRVVMRARIVLTCTEYPSNPAVSRHLGVALSIVRKWRARYMKEGIAGLYDRPRKNIFAGLILSAADRDQLQAIAQSDSYPEKLVMRARIVLACTEHSSALAVSRHLGIDYGTVFTWHKRYIEEGIAGLRDKPRKSSLARLALSAADRDQLQSILQVRRDSPRIVSRARILLALAEGLSIQAVAEHVGAHVETVYRWRNLYLAKGIACLDPQPSSRRVTYGAEKIAGAINRVKTEPPPNGRRWTLQSLADAEGVATTTASSWLKRHSIDLRDLQKDLKNSG